MERARARQRRLALRTLAGLAAGAFALGAVLGVGRMPKASVAGTLPTRQLAGERIVAGVTPELVIPETNA